jgi:hypothetical protein
MNSDISALREIAELPASEFDIFKAALRTLLAKSFIIRGASEREKEIYDFTVRNIPLFDAWLSCMEASLVRDESLGVVSFRPPGDMRLRLSREETCALLALRQMYEDKRAELHISAHPTATVDEFRQKYAIMTGGDLKKTALKNLLQKLCSLKLVAIDSPDFADPDALIALYPSIPLSVDREGIDEMLSLILKKEKPGEGEEDGGGDDDSGEADATDEIEFDTGGEPDADA